jgi:quinohemoprotein ethanol dehydrogenase
MLTHPRRCAGVRAATIACGALLGPGATAQDLPAAPAFTAQQLTTLPDTDWITNGGNVFNQRYSPLRQINRDTIKSLKAQWRSHLDGSGAGPQYSGQGQPLFYQGVLYVVTGADDVFAVDVKSGAHLWKYEAKLDPAHVRVCCGWVSRGLGLGAGRIFLGRLDAQLMALDQKTGKVLWSIQGENPNLGYSLVGAPLYYDGMVIVGYAGGDMGIRGRVKAYDASDGHLLWTFYTVPGPGEFGADTWPRDNDYYQWGGASVWQTPAIDPALGLVYFSTGNAGPDYGGAKRAGDNLFTASIVALEVKTGKYRWHFQQVHHDIWDYDSPNPVVLFDAPYQGRMRHGLAEISKTGWVYLLDRANGRPLLGIPERPVPQEPRQKTAATQPYPVGDPLFPQSVDMAPEGFKLINGGRIFTPFWDQPVVYRPQMAVNWPPSSYDPHSNYFFVCGIDNMAVSSHDAKDFTGPTFEGMWMQNGRFATLDVPRRGMFAAFDLKTNKLAWEHSWPQGCFSGSLATGGGLVFTGRSDGRLTALDSATGDLLWQFQTDAGVNAPASTFEYHGTQYVAVMSAGTLFSAGKKGDSIWLFSLHGRMESLPAAAVLPVVYAPGVPDLANGKVLYARFCEACHGEAGLGGHGGGAPLGEAAHDMKVIIATATNGKNQNMPPFRGALQPQELRDVAGYIAHDLFK